MGEPVSFTVLGVDPGREGALVLLDSSGALLGAMRMPMLGKDVHVAMLHSQFTTTQSVAFEQVRGMSPEHMGGGGFKAAESRGFFRGLVVGLCMAIGRPLLTISPQSWQKGLNLPKDRAERKARIVALAMERWPGLPIKCKRDWGMADAAFIAEAVRRRDLQPAGDPR